MLAELEASSVAKERAAEPRFYVPFIVAKIAAHRWLQLITRAGATIARAEAHIFRMVSDDWAPLVAQAGYMRDFQQLITINLCDISEYLSRDLEQHRAASKRGEDYTHKGCIKLLHSITKDFERVLQTAERIIDRMDRHLTMFSSAVSVHESRKSIQLSRRVG